MKSIRVVVKIMAPFLGTLNNRCRIIIVTPKRTLILTTTHKGVCGNWRQSEFEVLVVWVVCQIKGNFA